MSSGNNDKKLSLDALRNGDRAEFARMVEMNYELIYRLAFKMLDDPQDAEDILQETFIKAFRYIKNFDGRSSLSTWLYRIATNEALMFLRRRRPDQVSIDEPIQTEEGDQIPVQIVDWCCLPEDELMSSEAMSYLDQEMQRLSPGLRAVFVLRDIQGLSTREVGEILGVSETAVKTRLSRARMQLRNNLSSYYRERMSAQGENREGKRV